VDTFAQMRIIGILFLILALISCKHEDNTSPIVRQLEIAVVGKWKVVGGEFPFAEIEFLKNNLALAQLDSGSIPIRAWKIAGSNGLEVNNLGAFRNIRITSDSVTVFNGEYLAQGSDSWKSISMRKVVTGVIPTVLSSNYFYQTWKMNHLVIEGDSISMDTVGLLTLSFASSGTLFITGAYSLNPFGEGLVFDPNATEKSSWNWQNEEAKSYCAFETNGPSVCDSSTIRYVLEQSPSRLVLEERSGINTRIILTPYTFPY
jgi:hypothetical protein